MARNGGREEYRGWLRDAGLRLSLIAAEDAKRGVDERDAKCLRLAENGH